MSHANIISERETDGGWLFEVEVKGREQATVRLSWADYNLWSPDGSDAPQRVVEAVLAFLSARGAIDEWFAPRGGKGGRVRVGGVDCAVVRRKFPDADRVIPTLIQRRG